MNEIVPLSAWRVDECVATEPALAPRSGNLRIREGRGKFSWCQIIQSMQPWLRACGRSQQTTVDFHYKGAVCRLGSCHKRFRASKQCGPLWPNLQNQPPVPFLVEVRVCQVASRCDRNGGNSPGGRMSVPALVDDSAPDRLESPSRFLVQYKSSLARIMRVCGAGNVKGVSGFSLNNMHNPAKIPID